MLLFFVFVFILIWLQSQTCALRAAVEVTICVPQ